MKRVQVAGNTATGTLKLLALGLMLTDHAGKMVFGNCIEMRLLGRLAFPLYAWCMVVGAGYTHSMPRYIGRLALLGVVSQPLYMAALSHTWDQPNVLLTLTLGLCAIWGMKERKLLSQIWVPLAALALAELTGCDYGWRGVLLLMLLWGVRDSRPGIAAVMTAFCLYWGAGSATIGRAFGVSFLWVDSFALGNLMRPWLHLQTLAILALPLMLIRFRHNLRLPAWAGYGAYPAHLVLLMAMEGFLTPGGWANVAARWQTLVFQPIWAWLM